MVYLILVSISDEHRLFAFTSNAAEAQIEAWKVGTLSLRYFGTSELPLPAGLVAALNVSDAALAAMPIMKVVTSGGGSPQDLLKDGVSTIGIPVTIPSQTVNVPVNVPNAASAQPVAQAAPAVPPTTTVPGSPRIF